MLINPDNFGYNAGHSLIFDANSRVEDDVQVCAHCQRTLRKTEWRKNGGMCFGCKKPLCLTCAKVVHATGCKPFAAAMEESLESAERHAQFRRIAGLDAPPTIYLGEVNG